MPQNNSASDRKRSGTVAGMRDGLKKATTEMLVLFLLKQRSMYAYEMLQEMTWRSEGVLQFNTLYLALYRLQDYGFIKESKKVISENSRTRVYFALTPQGEIYLQELTNEYHTMTSAIDNMFKQDGLIAKEVN